MDRKRIEQILIIILALLNLFLLSVTLADRASARRAERETAQTVTALLAADGISVGTDAVLVQSPPAVCTVVRDYPLERAGMKTVIGSDTAESLGGSILFYRSERGQAVLRGTGEIDVLFTLDSVPIKGSREKTAEKLFSDAGVALSPWRMDMSDDGGHVECCCLWDGIPVYNARLDFDFSGDSLSMVTGTLVMGRETERSTEGVMDAVSALVRFLEIVRSEGFICSRLDALTPGYLMSVTVSGECTLTPVWHIETDTGELYVNALNGKTETVG